MKVMVIGLDGAPPKLVLEEYRDQLPNLNALISGGAYGPLETVNPPITVPAWACMMSGYDPGQLGFYGFRNRKDYSYDAYSIASSRDIKVDRVWDVLSKNDMRVILLGVPQTYPIRPVNGYVVSGFLTPSTESEYTYPPELKEEVERVCGGYVLDVENFRTSEKEALLERVYEKTRKHFALAKHMASTKPWDFFMMVEMGTDRIQHGFWSYVDSEHRKYHAGNPFETSIFDYYKFLDKEIGELISLVPRDTLVMVVSDHGAKKMDGGVCINEWLIQNGYLTLLSESVASNGEVRPLKMEMIDWDKTMAWGEGGYHGRLFLNVKGREPRGVIDQNDYDKVVQELKSKFEAMNDPDGKALGTHAMTRDELYPIREGVPPDLTVYFGDLSWRSVGSLGTGEIFTFDNDTGPDEANHDWHGILAVNDRVCNAMNIPAGNDSRIEGARLADVGRSILDAFKIDGHLGPVGRNLSQVA